MAISQKLEMEVVDQETLEYSKIDPALEEDCFDLFLYIQILGLWHLK